MSKDADETRGEERRGEVRRGEVWSDLHGAAPRNKSGIALTELLRKEALF